MNTYPDRFDFPTPTESASPALPRKASCFINGLLSLILQFCSICIFRPSIAHYYWMPENTFTISDRPLFALMICMMIAAVILMINALILGIKYLRNATAHRTLSAIGLVFAALSAALFAALLQYMSSYFPFE